MNTQFKKELSEKDLKSLEKHILTFLKNRWNHTNQDENADIFMKHSAHTFHQIENILGLAYTSSGVCAGLWVCNIELYLDLKSKYKIEGFVMDEGGFCWAWCMDEEENEIHISI